MRLIAVGTYTSIIEANLIKAKLETFGIDAVVEGDVAATSIPTIERIEGVKVLVREGDLPNAYEVLERMLPSGDQDDE
ncbi:MAG: DUF2007 domain-containing protein [Acidimicrobiia bacterium]